MNKPRVLVIEDEGLIAIDLQDTLAALGYDCVGPVMGLSDAIKVATTTDVDAAILNLILEGQPAYAVAEILDRRKIPFGFASGVMLTSIEPNWADRPFLAKPFSTDQFRGFLASVLDGAGRR